VTYTPTDTTNYNTATGSASVTVAKANPSVTTWPTASGITYGQTLASSSLSGGVATPAGSFGWTTPPTTPSVGTASQSVTYTPTDTTNYNTATGSASVTVGRATPTVNVVPVTVVYDWLAHGTTVSVAGVSGFTAPTGSASITYYARNLDGTKGTTLSSPPMGVGSYIAQGDYAGDTNYTIASGQAVITINPRTVTIAYTGRTSVPYGSCATTITATLYDYLAGNTPIANQPVTITIAGQSIIATTDSNGVATGTILLNQNPGSYTASASYGGNPIYAPNVSPNVPFTIGADPNVGPIAGQYTYTGSPLFWTASPTSNTATLTLSATIQDTGVCHGDIKTAKVTFGFRSADGTSVTPIPSAQNQPVGLVDPSNPYVGTATAIVQINLGNSKFESYTLAVVAGGNYVLNNSTTDSVITVAVPGQANTLDAAGYVDLHPITGSTSYPGSSGLLATAAGIVSGENGYLNVSGTVTYSKSGKTLTNPQGKMLLLFNSNNKPDGSVDTAMHRYQITSNSIAGLTAVAGTYQFTAKSNIVDLNNPGVTLDGGATMQVTFTAPSAGNPKGLIAISVIGKSGTTWLSSAWDGTKTVLKPLADGTVLAQ
jgi:hypothetical protein